MDIKLKSKKLSLKVILLVIAVYVAMAINVSMYIVNRNHDTDACTNDIIYEVNDVYNRVKGLSVYADGLDGQLKRDSLDFEVANIKKSIDNYKSGSELTVERKYLEMDDDAIRQEVTNRFKSYVDEQLAVIKNNPNIEFYYDSDKVSKPITNVSEESKDEFKNNTIDNYKKYLMIDKDKNYNFTKDFIGFRKEINFFNEDDNFNMYVRIAQPLQEGDSVYTAIKVNEYRQLESRILLGVIIIASIIVVVFALVLLKKYNNLELKQDKFINFLNRVDVEVKIMIIISAILSTVCIVNNLEFYTGRECLISMVMTSIFMYLVLAEGIRLRKVYLNKKFKSELINNSLLYRIIENIKKGKLLESLIISLINIFLGIVIFFLSGEFWDDVLIAERIEIFIYAIVTSLSILIIINSFITKYIKSVVDIEDKSKMISQGIYNSNINISGTKTFGKISNNLDNIQDGLKTAVDKAVKSEKMKAELITNVSHDLKTPLTSIISYVDLLSQENITEEQRKRYLNVLKDKSNRLKVLIEDLFEVSKAASGSVELNMVNLDPVSLLRQTLGEFEDKIEKLNLKIIKKFPKEKFIVYADGRKTFRVFQNLLSNIFKYSMENSRVYIEVIDDDEFVKVIFKNTSRDEINFTEEEILQRFKRGDASRSTEGSGLGLAIAKSLTEVQKGKFEVKVDGDLFKAIVRLRKQNNIE